MRNIVYVLTDKEQLGIDKLTRIRQKRDRKVDATTTYFSHADYDERARFEKTRMGFGAELAFCRLFGAKFDKSTKPRRGGHDTMWKGNRVDVKSCSKYDMPLMVPKGREYKADIWFLVHGDWPRYTLKGWALTDDMCQDKYLKDLKNTSGPTWVVEQENLLWLDQTDLFSYNDLRYGGY